MRSTFTLSKSFDLLIGSSVYIFWSIKAFLSVDSSFTSSFITFGIFCVAKIDDAKVDGCGVDCLNIGWLYDCVIGCCADGFVGCFSILDRLAGLPRFFFVIVSPILTVMFVFWVCFCFCFVVFGLIFF